MPRFLAACTYNWIGSANKLWHCGTVFLPLRTCCCVRAAAIVSSVTVYGCRGCRTRINRSLYYRLVWPTHFFEIWFRLRILARGSLSTLSYEYVFWGCRLLDVYQLLRGKSGGCFDFATYFLVECKREIVVQNLGKKINGWNFFITLRFFFFFKLSKNVIYLLLQKTIYSCY